MSERVLAALTDVMQWLDASQIPSMVIGGVAASMLGRVACPRIAFKIAQRRMGMCKMAWQLSV